MAPVLEQYAYSTIAKYTSYTAKATFDKPTKPGNFIVIGLVAAGGLPVWEIPAMPGYTLLKTDGLRDIQLTVWYRQNAPSITSLSTSVWGKTYRSLQLFVLEYSGVAQNNALDRIITANGETNTIKTSATGTLSQSDELILAFSVNQYAETSQSGFSGGLTRLFEKTSPQYYGTNGSNEDWERSRVTVHQAATTSNASITFDGKLSTTRRWLAFVLCFKGGTSGPVNFSAIDTNTSVFSNPKNSGNAALSAFGPLKATATDKPVFSNPDEGKVAIISPFNYQYRLGGNSGLLIGSGTEYGVEGTENMGGWDVRTSDTPIPRGDGSSRGIDLESAREFTMTINVGKNRDQIELLLDQLYRAVVPRRVDDWELIWRFPTQVPRMMRVRAVSVPRIRNKVTNVSYAKQTLSFVAADPRHYSAINNHVVIPNTPVGALEPVYTNVTNLGNIDAYPVITIKGPTSGEPVTRVLITNHSTLGTFTLEVTLPVGGVIIADMWARVTSQPVSIVTLDGQSRYGAWQLPREPFAISPDPTGQGGYNVISMETTPAGASVSCTMDYRHTWSG